MDSWSKNQASAEEVTSNVRSVALSSRREFENGFPSAALLADLYARYNPVPDLDLFLAIAKRTFPRGCCGLASLYLRHQLGGTVTRGTYDGKTHTFWADGDLIADITADQFGGPAVYVGSMTYPWLFREGILWISTTNHQMS